MVSAFRSSLPKATPFAGEACETNRSLVGTKVVGRKTRGTVLSYCSQPSRKFQRGTYVFWGRCVGVCQAIMLIGNAKQATSQGKIGPVETGLTGLAAMALIIANGNG